MTDIQDMHENFPFLTERSRWTRGRSMHAGLLSLAPGPAACLVKAISATLRVHVVRGEIEPTLRARRPNVIYAFWHGHLLYLMYRYRGSGAYIMVSQSHDGELLSRMLRRFGLPTIRGSSSRGGWRSLRALVQLVRGGASETLEGDWQPQRLVILEFPDRATAKAWWSSQAYAAPKALRQRSAHTELIVIDGV